MTVVNVTPFSEGRAGVCAPRRSIAEPAHNSPKTAPGEKGASSGANAPTTTVLLSTAKVRRFSSRSSARTETQSGPAFHHAG